jgi:hypothetical protein
MTQVSSLIALALSLSAGVATIGIGAVLLHNAAKEASDLVSVLPTLLLKEDTSEAREANRRKARREMLLFLSVRSAPGGVLLVSGAGLLIWTCYRLIPIFN